MTTGGTAADDVRSTFAYQYDLDGNRTSRVEGATTTTFTYDRADQVTEQVIGGTTRTFDYDRYGNLLTSADDTSAVTTYAYDEASRLTTISPPGGAASQVTFTLDALGRHATRALGSPAVTTDTYGYLDATETAWGTGTGTTSALLDADGSRLAIKTGSTVSWLLFDLHGSVAALCSTSGSLTDAYRYDGFGGQLAASGSATNPYRYRGLLNIGADALTGALLDMGARDYSPQLGVFTQQDSVQGSAANPLTMNRFLYALANPATLIDPDGHNACMEDESGRCVASAEANRQVAANQQKARAASSTTGDSASDDDYVVDVPGSDSTLTNEQIDALSFGQLRMYYEQNKGRCNGAFFNWPGCEDIGYAYCSLGNRLGGTADCHEFSRPPDPSLELTIDAGAVLTALTLGRITPAVIDWMRKNPDKVQPLLTISQNRIAGTRFEQAAIKWLSTLKNGQMIPGFDRIGQLKNVIPDSLLRGVWEFKNVKSLVDARGQISAMGEMAARFGQRFDIFLGPRFQGQISTTVKDAVDLAGGAIWRLDPGTGFLVLEYGTLPFAPR